MGRRTWLSITISMSTSSETEATGPIDCEAEMVASILPALTRAGTGIEEDSALPARIQELELSAAAICPMVCIECMVSREWSAESTGAAGSADIISCSTWRKSGEHTIVQR